ncbi:MAG TPA: hypothetical protein PLU10_00175 [Chitinophagaceae bacterium]|nr:hypothetical protein [Chitinophagaceae bacterium]
MKPSLKIFISAFASILMLGILIVSLSSCSKSSFLLTDDKGGLSDSPDALKTMPISTLNTSTLMGTWHATYYFDKKDKTSKLNGYTFTMLANGTINVVGAMNVTGTWSVNASLTKLKLNLGTVKPLSELNEDYAIISQTANQLQLTHVSGGNGGTSLLTLEK